MDDFDFDLDFTEEIDEKTVLLLTIYNLLLII
jgi:hypothetical protein